MVWLIRATAPPVGQGRTATGADGPPAILLKAPPGAVNQVSRVAGALMAPHERPGAVDGIHKQEDGTDQTGRPELAGMLFRNYGYAGR